MLLQIKRLLIAAICLFAALIGSFVSYSQERTTSLQKLYGQLATGPSTRDGAVGEFSLQGVFKNNWTATFSYMGIAMDPKNLPKDYDPGYVVIIIIPIPNSYPENELKIYSVTAGKLFEARRNIWFTTEAGLSVIQGQEFSFASQAPLRDFLGQNPNYTTHSTSKTGFGGLLRADVNWVFSSFAGLGLGTFASINTVQSTLGIEIKLMLGWMNRKDKNK